MNLVQRSIAEGDLGAARKLLNKHRPDNQITKGPPQMGMAILLGTPPRAMNSTGSRISPRLSSIWRWSPTSSLIAARKQRGDIQLWDLETRQLPAP